MSSNNKWKSSLLSSSLPLEFEVAKILVSKRFSVRSDYTYARDDAGLVKDFSVDIAATAYTPFTNPNKVTSTLELLIECKYRTPNVSWFFLPDTNTPDFSPITLGTTLRMVHEFSPYVIHLDATVEFDEQLKHCYKGVEIQLATGNVYDAEIRHGILQLQYALPRLFTQLVSFNGGPDPEQNCPFFFCPILLTNAELFVANAGITMREVENSSSITDLGTKVPFFVFYQDYGPDFERHCVKECTNLSFLDKSESINVLTDMIKKSKHSALKYTALKYTGQAANSPGASVTV